MSHISFYDVPSDTSLLVFACQFFADIAKQIRMTSVQLMTDKKLEALNKAYSCRQTSGPIVGPL